MKIEKRGPGNPRRGKKERITINIEDSNLKWLKQQRLSYSRIVNKLLSAEIANNDNPHNNER